MAWVVYPSTRQKAPVVVVVHEIFGLSTWVRGVADQVAADGFIAIAPDFLSGCGAARPRSSSPRIRPGGSSGDVEQHRAQSHHRGRGQLGDDPAGATPKYAVIGYCWGGQTTFMHAIHGGVTGFSGGVAFYGPALYDRRQSGHGDPAGRTRDAGR
jgi:carboxymethylenebutenolidase